MSDTISDSVNVNGKRITCKKVPFGSLTVERDLKKIKVSRALTVTQAKKQEARIGLLNWLKSITHDELLTVGCHSINSKKLLEGIDLARNADIDSFLGFREEEMKNNGDETEPLGSDDTKPLEDA